MHLTFHALYFQDFNNIKVLLERDFFYSNSVKKLPKKLHEKKIVNIFVGNTKTK